MRRSVHPEVLILIANNDGDAPSTLQKKLVHRQIAWPYALMRSLRRQDVLADAKDLLDPDELDHLRAAQRA